MIWPEDISTEQRNIVEELKRRTENDVTPKMLEDESLFYRFCKARDFVLKDAENMLRKHISWKTEHGIDTILTDYKPPEVFKKYAPIFLIGYDKEGCVVRYIDGGGADVIGILKSASQWNCLKYCVYLAEYDLETLKLQSKKLGKLLTKSVFIFNFANFTFAKATHKKAIEAVLRFLVIVQDNYPERIKCIYFINAPYYFYLGFSILKTVLSSALLEKMRFYGTDGWKEDLLQVIDADVLPAFLGGNRTDPDGNLFCRTIIPETENVPKRYYLRNNEKKLYKARDVNKLIVTRFSKEELSVDIKTVGSYLEWEFETKNRDIGFAIYFHENSSEKSERVEVIANQRIDTCGESGKGLLKCEKAGTYIAVFDNSFSWIYSKELYYRIKIIAPNDLIC